jgi:hypothetical protein
MINSASAPNAEGHVTAAAKFSPGAAAVTEIQARAT